MKKIRIFFILSMLPLFLSACTKSGALTGSGSGGSSSFGTITGSANGGLSPLSGALVNLRLGGNPTAVASATTAADGSFSIVFNGQTSGNFLYLTIAGGNSGSGTNSNNQLMSIVGTSGAPLSSLKVNEMSTAATELVGMNMGLLNDSNGTITLNAPKNAAGASNVVTQFQNLIANGNLNTSNSNLTSSAQTGLAVMANAFASCIENSSNCGTLFSSAKTSAGAAALSVLESGYNALLNSSNVASPLYTLAFPFHSTTGFNLTSSSMPGGFTFNNGLAAANVAFNIGQNSSGMGVDASGNFWVLNYPSANTVTKLSSSGAALGTFAVGTNPSGGLGIDASGNVWIANNGGNVTELNSSGTTLGTFSAGSNTEGIAIDPSGNVWASNFGTTTVTKLSSSGTTLGTFQAGGSGFAVIFDAGGNAWIANRNEGTITELSSSGGQLLQFSTSSSSVSSPNSIAFDSSGNLLVNNCSGCGGGLVVAKYNQNGVLLASATVGSTPQGLIVDGAGNIWCANYSSGSISEMNSSLSAVLATYATGTSAPLGLVTDTSGNLWFSSQGSNTVNELPGITQGPQFFPYSGPQFPGATY